MADGIQPPIGPTPAALPVRPKGTPLPPLSAQAYELRLSVQDASLMPVVDSQQVVTVEIDGTTLAARFEGPFYTVQVPRGPISKINVLVTSPKYFDFVATFNVYLADNGIEIWRKTAGGIASATTLAGQLSVDAFVILSRLRRVDNIPGSPILRHEGPNWFHRQLNDDGPYAKGFEFPLLEVSNGIVASDTKAVGSHRLVYAMQTPVRPQGNIYVFELKTATAPKLIFAWHTAKMDFSKRSPGGIAGPIGYHFYYHPTPRATADYPYGTDKANVQPHVDLGYQHLMWASWGSVQHYYSSRRVVYVVPVGSLANLFGEAGSAAGIYNLLRETNLAIHVENNADAASYLLQDVGRVAVSGFSAGASYMIAALSQESDAAGKEFISTRLAEIYSWDGAIGGNGISNTVPADFSAFTKRWWRDATQNIRVYTQNSAYDSALSFLQQFAKKSNGPANSYVKSYQQDGSAFGTLVVLPDGFFRKTYQMTAPVAGVSLYALDPLDVYKGNDATEKDAGFPAYQDTHHWFFKVFMYHAMMHSGFQAI